MLLADRTGKTLQMNTPHESDVVKPAAEEVLGEPASEGFLVETTDSVFSAYVVLGDMDYPSQLSAIHDLLERQKDADRLLAEKIKEADEFARRTTGILNMQAIDDHILHVRNSTYQDAAHSMAAVGMLAPLIESIFCQSFDNLRRKFLEPDNVPFSSHLRWQWSNAAQWDCHFVWSNRGRRKDLVEGIMQLAEAIGLSSHLPADLKPRLQALFEYRNKMFHHGFEWPLVERERFQRRIQTAKWPSDWFTTATTGDSPWIFYLSDSFIQHCLTTVYSVLSGVGIFARKLREDRDRRSAN
jgi:hypothetical protein